MSEPYKDSWISAGEQGVSIRFYYFPFGTKHIPYAQIHSITRVNMGALTGRARIWGTSSFRFWASLDPQRPRKQIAYVLDLGHAVRPYITPDDPNAFESAVSAFGSVPVEIGGRGRLI